MEIPAATRATYSPPRLQASLLFVIARLSPSVFARHDSAEAISVTGTTGFLCSARNDTFPIVFARLASASRSNLASSCLREAPPYLSLRGVKGDEAISAAGTTGFLCFARNDKHSSGQQWREEFKQNQSKDRGTLRKTLDRLRSDTI